MESKYSAYASQQSKSDNLAEQYIIFSLYFGVGFASIFIIAFVLLIFVNQLSHKKNIYNIFKYCMWYEIIISFHLIKGSINVVSAGISNYLVCKIDSGITYYAMNLACYYYLIIMAILMFTKGSYPLISGFQRILISVPAALGALVSVILFLSHNSSIMTPWYTCFLSEDYQYFFIFYLYWAVSFIFLIMVLLRKVELKGIMLNFHYFNLINSICFIGFYINLYLNTALLGSISLVLYMINIIYFRLRIDAVSHSFIHNNISKNRFIFFIATILCIDSPPSESTVLDVQEDQIKVIEEYHRRITKKLSKTRLMSDSLVVRDPKNPFNQA